MSWDIPRLVTIRTFLILLVCGACGGSGLSSPSSCPAPPALVHEQLLVQEIGRQQLVAGRAVMVRDDRRCAWSQRRALKSHVRRAFPFVLYLRKWMYLSQLPQSPPGGHSTLLSLTPAHHLQGHQGALRSSPLHTDSWSTGDVLGCPGAGRLGPRSPISTGPARGLFHVLLTCVLPGREVVEWLLFLLWPPPRPALLHPASALCPRTWKYWLPRHLCHSVCAEDSGPS